MLAIVVTVVSLLIKLSLLMIFVGADVVIGFVESAYIGEERGEAHSVLAGYLSGIPDNRTITYVPTSITASKLFLSALYVGVSTCSLH